MLPILWLVLLFSDAGALVGIASFFSEDPVCEYIYHRAAMSNAPMIKAPNTIPNTAAIPNPRTSEGPPGLEFVGSWDLGQSSCFGLLVSIFKVLDIFPTKWHLFGSMQ